MNLIVSLNDGTTKKEISDVTDTHYTNIVDTQQNIIITGNRFMLKNYLEVKMIFSPILITPQHRIYLTRLNSTMAA